MAATAKPAMTASSAAAAGTSSTAAKVSTTAMAVRESANRTRARKGLSAESVAALQEALDRLDRLLRGLPEDVVPVGDGDSREQIAERLSVARRLQLGVGQG